MANFFDQAKAIWEALDSMSEKDPEGYKQFISDQLQTGKNDFLKKSASKDEKLDETKNSTQQSKCFELEDAFAKLSVGERSMIPTGTGSSCKPAKNKERLITSKKGTETESSQNGRAMKNPDKKERSKVEVHLLDDEIHGGHSLLTGIVKSPPPNGSSSEEEGIINLIIPSGESAPQGIRKNKTVPMIEEI